MTTLLSNFMEKVQAKHWQDLRRRTQKLDPVDRGYLLELLEDNLAASAAAAAAEGMDGSAVEDHEDNPKNCNDDNNNNNNNDDDDDDDEFAEEDYELLQKDLDRANLRLEELQSRHDFLKTRLETYRSRIAHSEEFLERSASSAAAAGDLSPERRETMASKIAGYKRALEPVEETYSTISEELEKHRAKIESMQDRQWELKIQTQECQVVLEELCFNLEETARLPYQSEKNHDQEILATLGSVEDKEEEEESGAKKTTNDPETPVRDKDDGDGGGGDVELAGINANDDDDDEKESNHS